MDLKQLIASTKGERSYDELARLAGGVPSSQRWQQLAKNEQKAFPDPATIRGVAVALGVGELVVLKAWATSLGLSVPDSDSLFVTLLPPRVDRLTEAQVAALRHVLLVMLEPADASPAIAQEEAVRADLRKAASNEKATGGVRPNGPKRRQSDLPS